MMLAFVAAAAALNPVERLYLRHGHRANSFSAAFDPDLERHVTDEGFVAFARHECTKTSLAFFDPVGADMETVLDAFMKRERQRGSVAFWKVSTCVEINKCVGCTRQLFTKSFPGDDAAVLAPSSGEEPASPSHRAGAASMAWRTTR